MVTFKYVCVYLYNLSVDLYICISRAFFQVVMEAPMSLLKRSLHCLVDLQVKFEEHMDSTTVR